MPKKIVTYLDLPLTREQTRKFYVAIGQLSSRVEVARWRAGERDGEVTLKITRWESGAGGKKKKT